MLSTNRKLSCNIVIICFFIVFKKHSTNLVCIQCNWFLSLSLQLTGVSGSASLSSMNCSSSSSCFRLVWWEFCCLERLKHVRSTRAMQILSSWELCTQSHDNFPSHIKLLFWVFYSVILMTWVFWTFALTFNYNRGLQKEGQMESISTS